MSLDFIVDLVTNRWISFTDQTSRGTTSIVTTIETTDSMGSYAELAISTVISTGLVNGDCYGRTIGWLGWGVCCGAR